MKNKLYNFKSLKDDNETCQMNPGYLFEIDIRVQASNWLKRETRKNIARIQKSNPFNNSPADVTEKN
jgi:hypothetical protein